MNSISTRSKKFAFLAVAAIALAACGGSSENSNIASTVALGVKNAALSCAAGGACRVGDTGPGGGKVFYVAPASFTSTGSACGTACKYLEAAPIGWIKAATPAGQTNCAVAGTSTADPYCAWSGNTTTRIGTTSNAIGAGYANTSAIITQSNVAGRAATVARAFQGGGKTDWFLPSKDELTQVYRQKSVLGGFDFNYYWSSSEGAAGLAWFQGFDGYGDNGAKTATLYVRPVRAFSDSATVAAPVTTSTSTTTTVPGRMVNGYKIEAGARLTGANLREADLSKADLSGANLSKADLSKANLTGANLTGANLNQANLVSADLTFAMLYGANLSGANLRGANLYGANLRGANLTFAMLYGANLTGANLTQANLSDLDLRGLNLRGLNLRGANLSKADLSKADLSGANLSKADLTGAKLTGADLTGADLFGADLSDADLTGANLSGAYLYGANLSGAIR